MIIITTPSRKYITFKITIISITFIITAAHYGSIITIITIILLPSPKPSPSSLQLFNNLKTSPSRWSTPLPSLESPSPLYHFITERRNCHYLVTYIQTCNLIKRMDLKLEEIGTFHTRVPLTRDDLGYYRVRTKRTWLK